MIKYGLVFLFLLLNGYGLFAQSPASSCVKSTEGKEFWFGFLENRPGINCVAPFLANYLEVTVTSRYNCQFTITIGKSATPVITDVLQPNIPKKFRLDRTLAEPSGSENIEAKAVHLVSDQPLNLYAMNYGLNSSDAAVIFPVEALGQEYFAICYEPHVKIVNLICGASFNGKNSEFAVVASEDQTLVTITPSKITDHLMPANIPFTITLNKGEMYQVQSMNSDGLIGQGDLTGSLIRSDKPIALYSGSWATTIPNSSNNAWDHLYEQIPPVRSWGRKFVTVPLKSRGKDTYRILASVDQTTVRIAGKATVVLDRGKFYEWMLNSNEPSLIESDHPVLLAQYSNSNDVDIPAILPIGTTWDGDPSMLIISPVDQTRENVTFVAYDTPEITTKIFVNVVAQDNAAGKIQLDGNPIPFVSLPNSGYSYAQVQIAVGNHNLNSTETGKGFIAYVYGFGGVESYGYGVGFNLSTHLDLGGDIHFVRDTLLLCNGETKILDAGSQFSGFLWNTGETTQRISVSKNGYYEVKATTSEGCELKDSIYAMESHPKASLPIDPMLCAGGSLLLDAGNFNSYLWSTLQTSKSISVTNPGKFLVSIVDKYGCTGKDSVNVGMSSLPVLKKNRIDSLLCGTKNTFVDITADKGIYTLTSADPAVLIQGLSATVPQFGTYSFTFKATDQFSCATDTSFLLKFRKNSSAAIQIDSTCFGYGLDAKYLGDAVLPKTSFIWILAQDTIASGVGIDRVHTQLGSGLLGANLSLLLDEAGCQPQKVEITINEPPDLNFAPADSVVCLGGDLRFTASHLANIIDFAWYWGDGVVEHLTGNALHRYTNLGSYDVQLTVMTDKSCTNTIKKTALVNVVQVPTIDFSFSGNSCLAQGSHSIFYLGSAGIGDHFHWDLSGFLPGEVIQNPGDSSKPLIFDLKYQPEAKASLQVISKYGCASDSKSVLLKRKPLFSLLTPIGSGCAPLTVQMNAKAGDLVDKILYQWLFGDGTFQSGNNISHVYAHADQPYDLTLIAASEATGCKDTLLVPHFVTVNPSPKAAFAIPQQIYYLENPSVSFQNESQAADRFAWDFGDGTISADKNPIHTYTMAGNRTVILEAANGFGCSDTTSAQIAIAMTKIYAPNAFSPNATNQPDREFKLYANGVIAMGYHLKIISRWNDVVFECKNLINGWDGHLPDGSMAPPGTYIWILEFNDFMGKSHRQEGSVVLIF